MKMKITPAKVASIVSIIYIIAGAILFSRESAENWYYAVIFTIGFLAVVCWWYAVYKIK